MSVIQVQLPDDLLGRARQIAEEQELPVEQIIADAVQHMVQSRDDMQRLELRAKRGKSVDFKALLRRAPDVEPDASDRIE